jgi:hypothetical protein
VNTIWIVVGLVVVAVVIAFVTSRQRRNPDADLGAVSNHWISEHRMDR